MGPQVNPWKDSQLPVRAGTTRGRPEGLRLRRGSMWGGRIVVRWRCVHSSRLQLQVESVCIQNLNSASGSCTADS